MEINYFKLIKNKNKNIKNKILCEKYINNNICEKQHCNKAHRIEDLNINKLYLNNYDNNFFIFHFKNEICPFIEIIHNKENCVFAHDINDFKRCYKPNLIPQMCSYWMDKDKVCKNNINCYFCHNIYELNYHPLVYRTKNCYLKNSKKNCLDKKCYYYHSKTEQRRYDKNIKFNFRFAPKNLLALKNQMDIIK